MWSRGRTLERIEEHSGASGNGKKGRGTGKRMVVDM